MEKKIKGSGIMMKYIASVSFGKDSLAMLFKIIELKMPIDEVVFYDTGMEFQAIYDTRDKIIPILEQNNIKYVELYPKLDFNYLMFDKPVCKRGTKEVHKYGYGWCGGPCRWGTTEKLKKIEQYCKGHYEYVGIAYDEQKRLNKERKGNKLFPLADLNMTEKDCLEYCYEKGIFWEENGIRLYDVLDRVSCWCCRNKNLKELKNIYKYMPDYWKKLKEIQDKLGEEKPMKQSGSVNDLEKRFESETNE